MNIDLRNLLAEHFGFGDFIFRDPKTKAEIKEEIEQQQRDKNTPVTVDEKAVHEEDETYDRHYGWLWILLALLLLAGIGFGLYYFKVVDFKQWMERKEKPTEIEPWKLTLPSTVRTWNTEQVAPVERDSVVKPMEEVVPETKDSLVEPPKEVVQAPEPMKPEANIRIIAGCFAQEENAERLANTLRDKGYQYAFIEKRGSKWFVAYGRYASDEEANTALREIREKWNDKAWILK